MLGIHDFGVFLASCILLNITPGPDTFYILGRSMAQGRAAGVASALGISAGSLVHTAAAAFGFSALLAASATAFMVVKLAGAVYLIYLGACLLLSKAEGPGAPVRTDFTKNGWGSIFRQGMITNVLNPKVALFFLAFMPQFIAADSGSKFVAFLALGLCFVTTGTLWCLGLAWFSARIGARLRGSGYFSEMLQRAVGALFVALGVRLGISK